MPKRLEFRIIISLALVLAAMIAVYGWWTGSMQSRVYIQSLSSNLQVLARSHADNAAHYLIIQEYAGLEEHMMEAANLPDVLEIKVIEPDGKILCNIERPAIGEPPRLIYKIRTIPPPPASIALITRESDRLTSWTPITAGDHLGWLKMTLSLHTAEELQRSTWHSTLQIGLLWIVVGIGLMVLVVKKPLRAIRELSRFAHDLQNRKGAQVSVTRGVLEIDLLADALNHSSSELLAAEQKLIAERERLTVTLQSIGDGVIATDMDSGIMLVNHVAERLTGWSQDQAIGHRLEEVFRLEGDSTAHPLKAVFAEGRTVELTGLVRLVSLDNSLRIVTVNGAPIINSSGVLAGMVLVFSDVTEKTEMEAEKKKLEEQLIQSQKMESVGQLAGGIAHDFNNILTAITGYGEMLRTKVSHDEKLASYADQVLASAGRAANLTRALLAFSRKQAIELQSADINTIVNGIQKLLGRLIGEDINLTARTSDKPLQAMVDAGQLEQILMNLATNARDALPNGGELAIETDEVFVDELYSNSIANGKPGRYALITVSDNGEGMDQETCTRIFEPFFTTKKVGKGTGLGLSIVYGIVRQHGGFVTVYSEAGHGTSFRIYIPLSEVSEQKQLHEITDEEKHGTETILLAEDDSDVRNILALTLSEAGYTIISAACGTEAVTLFGENHCHIDLILMDVIMPSMNGKEAYTRISEQYPEARVIFMSGYTADIILHKGIMDDDINFIHKPVSKQQLLKKIRDVLDSDPTPHNRPSSTPDTP
jgi:PAS domain S-box-containing protein